MTSAEQFADIFQKKNDLPESRFTDPYTNAFLNDISPYVTESLKLTKKDVEKYHNKEKKCYAIIYLLTTKVMVKIHAADDIPKIGDKTKYDIFNKYVNAYDSRFMIPVCIKTKKDSYCVLMSQPWVIPEDIQKYKDEIVQNDPKV